MKSRTTKRTPSELAQLLAACSSVADNSAAAASERPSQPRGAQSGDQQVRQEPSPIHCALIRTVLGRMIAAATNEGICLLEFLDAENTAGCTEPAQRLRQQIERVQRRFAQPLVERRHAHLTSLRQELIAYLRGTQREFSVPLAIRGTDFQQTVWLFLQQLPYGSTISYQQLAEQVGRPDAVRAVGAANGANPLSLLVPCHRVIGQGGALTGYGGGIPRKKWLLALEAGERRRFIQQ